MLSNEQLEQIFRAGDGVSDVQVRGDGYHYELTIVSNTFLGQSKIARQQWVYGLLKDYITSGRLHALSMKTWTQDEWEKQRG